MDHISCDHSKSGYCWRSIAFLWSETLFIFETLLFIIAYWSYMRNHTMKALIVVATVTAVSCITRYAGVTIIGAGGLLLLLDNQLTMPQKDNPYPHIRLYIDLLIGR